MPDLSPVNAGSFSAAERSRPQSLTRMGQLQLPEYSRDGQSRQSPHPPHAILPLLSPFRYVRFKVLVDRVAEGANVCRRAAAAGTDDVRTGLQERRDADDPFVRG